MVDEASLTEHQRLVLQTTYDRFRADGTWPTFIPWTGRYAALSAARLIDGRTPHAARLLRPEAAAHLLCSLSFKARHLVVDLGGQYMHQVISDFH